MKKHRKHEIFNAIFKEMYIKKQLHSVFSYQIDKYWKIMNAIAHEEMRK